MLQPPAPPLPSCRLPSWTSRAFSANKTNERIELDSDASVGLSADHWLTQAAFTRQWRPQGKSSRSATAWLYSRSVKFTRKIASQTLSLLVLYSATSPVNSGEKLKLSIECVPSN